MTPTSTRHSFAFVICLFWLLCSALHTQAHPPQTNPTQTSAARTPESVIQETRAQSAEVQKLIEAGNFPEAQILAEKVLVAREQALGPDHAEVASSLTQLAAIARNRRDLAKAETLNQRALTIAEKVPAPGHPELGQMYNEMGAIYQSRADFVKAEPAYLRAVAVWEQTLGANHPNIARALSNLGSIYAQRGDRAKAEPTLRRALAIREQALGAENPALIVTLVTLGNLYFSQQQFDQAAPYYQRVLGIVDAASSPVNPPQYLPALANLAALRVDKGDFTGAETLYRRVLPLQEKAFGPEDPQTLTTHFNLAVLRANLGDYAQAAQMHESVLAQREKALGPDHPSVALSLRNLARTYTARGDLPQAITTLSRANEVIERNIVYNLTAGSERAKLAYLTTAADETDRTLSLHLRSAPNDQAARRLALTVLLQRKGRALDAMIDSLNAVRRRATAEDRTLLEQLRTTRADIARLALAGPPPRTKLEDHRNRVKALEEQRDKLEDQISRSSAEFRAQTQSVTLDAVQAAIPANSALIEFATYHPFNARFTKLAEAYDKPRYAAYILRREGEPQAIELGDKQQIDEAIERWRKALRNRQARNVKTLARAVDRLVMQPLRPLLGRTRRVLLAPEGSLNLIPFAALVDGRNQFLIKRYQFSYLTSGRDLLRLQVKQPSRQRALIVANPDFGESKTALAPAERILKIRPAPTGSANASILSVAFFPALPGTAGEADALKTLLPEATLYSAQQASETQVKQAVSPSILHIATHGFFFEDSPAAPRSATAAALANLQLDNPLLRSGLALAGANQLKASAEDDGILTALETAGLDLWGTQMVVLSACDTGVGEVKNGEGVYGLRRALVLAGSEAQVMSLWPVSDLVTRDLMIAFYRRLQADEGRADALHRVQLQMLTRGERASVARAGKPAPRNDTDYSHPYYWASFILSGESAPLGNKP
jgi:CHAT domain-containing protein/Tfp pilus assembly protein PilF